MKYDIFISHASEDKEAVALPLASHLKSLGMRVWIDENEIRLGDSLRRSIDAGLASSRYGVAIISPAFLNKEWPKKELDGLFAREQNGSKVIIPIWHNLTLAEVIKASPLLADKKAISTKSSLEVVAKEICSAIPMQSPTSNVISGIGARQQKEINSQTIKKYVAIAILLIMYFLNPGEAKHEAYISNNNKNDMTLTPVYNDYLFFSATYDDPSLKCKNGYTINLAQKEGQKFISCTDKNDGEYDYSNSKILTFGFLWKIYATDFFRAKVAT